MKTITKRIMKTKAQGGEEKENKGGNEKDSSGG
jgi:hypothetical protein